MERHLYEPKSVEEVDNMLEQRREKLKRVGDFLLKRHELEEIDYLLDTRLEMTKFNEDPDA